MQLRVAKSLNQLLAFIALLVVGLGVAMFFLSRSYPQLKWVFMVSFVVVAVALLLFFRWLESNWDKRVITSMAKDGKIALANIKSAKRILHMRDTSLANYWLYEFEADLYDPEMEHIEKTFYEKMNYTTERIPLGSVYVTYDYKKPNQIFIIPNALIGHIPELAPIVRRFEDNRNINVKYLDAFYNKGMVLQSMRESVAQQKARQKQQEG